MKGSEVMGVAGIIVLETGFLICMLGILFKLLDKNPYSGQTVGCA